MKGLAVLIHCLRSGWEGLCKSATGPRLDPEHLHSRTLGELEQHSELFVDLVPVSFQENF